MILRLQVIRKLRHLVGDERGSTLAELAIMVPFLALMLAGVCEFGRFFHTYTTLAKATRSASRYLSNHNLTPVELDRATSLVVCGKLACAGGDQLVKGFTASNVCLESTGEPEVTSVTVRIPRAAGDCGVDKTALGDSADSVPYIYQPIFDIGALLQSPTFTLALAIRPSTTMHYMLD